MEKGNSNENGAIQNMTSFTLPQKRARQTRSCGHHYFLATLELLQSEKISNQNVLQQRRKKESGRRLKNSKFYEINANYTLASDPSNMVDIEDRSNTAAQNPYRGPGPATPEQMVLDKLKYTIFMLISGYALITKFNLLNVILKSPHVSHEWFKIGLAGTVGK